MPAAHDQQAVPVTVLGGYLGSGKTTRINALLAEPDGLRVAVVVNDFGSVNIDAELLRSRAGDLLEMANGCVCCSLADGMASVMHQIVDRRPRPDHVLIEVSGVGDPAAVAKWSGLPGLAPGGVVVCVDAETIEARAADRWVGDTVLRQLAGAGLLLLTKTDLIALEQVERVRSWLDRSVPGTPVDARPDALIRVLRDSTRAAPVDTGVTGQPHGDHRSWSLTTTETVDQERLVACLDGLPPEVVRAKGVIRTRERPGRRTVVQRVGRRCALRDDGPWRSGEQSVLVLIAVTGNAVWTPDRALAGLFET